MAPLGFRTAGFRDWNLAEAFDALARIGYDGVELCLEHPQMRPETLDARRCREICDLADESGLQIAAVSYHADQEDSAVRFENQRRAVELTAYLGGKILILNSRKVEEGQREQQWNEFRELLCTTLLPEARQQGVRIAVEPEPGMFVHGSREMQQLLVEVADPFLGVNFDIGHAWLTDDDVCRSISRLGPHILHSHWEDFPAGIHRHLLPGTGDMPLAQIHAAFVQSGFEGYYTVDLFHIHEDPVTYANDAIAAMRRIIAGKGE